MVLKKTFLEEKPCQVFFHFSEKFLMLQKFILNKVSASKKFLWCVKTPCL